MKISIILRHEFRRLFKNKKVIFTSLILPIIVSIAFVSGLGLLDKTFSKEIINVYCTDSVYEKIEKYKSDKVKLSGIDEYDESVLSNKNNTAIIIDDDIEIKYNSSSISSTTIMSETHEVANKIYATINGNEIESGIKFNTHITNDKNDITYEERLAISMLPLVIMMSVLMSILPLAVETIAGEREKKTFDKLKISGVTNSSIALGKTLYIFILNVILYFILFLVTIFALYKNFPDVYERINSLINNRTIIMFMIVSFESIFICSLSLICLSSFFNESKSAGNYASLLMVIISVAHGFNPWLEKPILNVPMVSNLELILHTMIGENMINNLLCTVIITIVLCVALVLITNRNIKGEME